MEESHHLSVFPKLAQPVTGQTPEERLADTLQPYERTETDQLMHDLYLDEAIATPGTKQSDQFQLLQMENQARQMAVASSVQLNQALQASP